MEQSLTEIAKSLEGTEKKVQLIYAFNGVGKTRLSREFKELISPKAEVEEQEESGIKIMYYNAFTEDLFYWDNDLDNDQNRKLIIRPNNFTHWALADQGQENNIISNFQHYTSPFLTPRFSPDFSEVSFSIERGDDERLTNIKVSKGEESNFIWCVFYSLLEQVVETLNVVEPNERDTDQFNHLQYVFIDDPVCSLDDNHIIELAVNLAQLIKSSLSEVKFIITTHNPLFYNVLFNEFSNDNSRSGFKWRKDCQKHLMKKFNDGTYSLSNQYSDSPFSYHLYLMTELENAIESGEIKKYHFNFLRNILEKTSTFLGYTQWKDLLPNEAEGAREGYYNRIINLSSHGKFSGEEVSIIDDNEKRVIERLVNNIKEMYHFKSSQN